MEVDIAPGHTQHHFNIMRTLALEDIISKTMTKCNLMLNIETNIVTENGEKERERVGDRDPPSDHCPPHFLFLSSQKQSSLFEEGISMATI